MNIILYFLIFYNVVFFSTESKLLKVSIYYETLCPDSIEFIKKQFLPVFKKLEKYIQPDLVPFGKAVQKAEGRFMCQHGEIECLGNKMHSCVLNLNSIKMMKKMLFVSCTVGSRLIWQSGLQCADKLDLSWHDINTCMYDNTGNRYVVENGIQTHSLYPPLSFVPTIIINDSAEVTSDQFHNFEQLVCQMLEYPSECD